MSFPLFIRFENVWLIMFRGAIVAYPTDDAVLTMHVIEKFIRRQVHYVRCFTAFVNAAIRNYILSNVSSDKYQISSKLCLGMYDILDDIPPSG